MNIFGSTFNALEQSLDYATLKNQTITTNIANVDTPGYKSKNVVFKDVLNKAYQTSIPSKRTHEKHLSFSDHTYQPYKVISKNNTQYNHNGNNVDIDVEMTELAKNQIYYQSLVERINGKFNSLQTVIRGGR